MDEKIIRLFHRFSKSCLSTKWRFKKPNWSFWNDKPWIFSPDRKIPDGWFSLKKPFSYCASFWFPYDVEVWTKAGKNEDSSTDSFGWKNRPTGFDATVKLAQEIKLRELIKAQALLWVEAQRRKVWSRKRRERSARFVYTLTPPFCWRRRKKVSYHAISFRCIAWSDDNLRFHEWAFGSASSERNEICYQSVQL